MSNEAQELEMPSEEVAVEILSTEKLKHDEGESIVEGTLQVIAEAERREDDKNTSKENEGEICNEQTSEDTGDGIDLKTLDGKQVLFVAAQDPDENIVNMSSDGKQFLIVAAQDSSNYFKGAGYIW